MRPDASASATTAYSALQQLRAYPEPGHIRPSRTGCTAEAARQTSARRATPRAAPRPPWRTPSRLGCTCTMAATSARQDVYTSVTRIGPRTSRALAPRCALAAASSFPCAGTGLWLVLPSLFHTSADCLERFLHFFCDSSELRRQHSLLRIDDHVNGVHQPMQVQPNGFAHTPSNAVALDRGPEHPANGQADAGTTRSCSGSRHLCAVAFQEEYRHQSGEMSLAALVHLIEQGMLQQLVRAWKAIAGRRRGDLRARPVVVHGAAHF